jgi:hypothetical protein
MKSGQIDACRKAQLARMSSDLRLLAISRHGDVRGWQIARLLREAETVSEADEAKRQWKLHQDYRPLLQTA